MARINYTAVLKGIRDLLTNDPNIRQLDAVIEISAPTVVGMRPHINIFEGRRTPTPGQPLAAGTQTRYTIQWQINVSAFSGDGFADAGAQRDEVIGHVETALMASRNLGGILADKSLLLQGGDLRSGRGDSGFWAEGTIDLTAEATIKVP